MFPSLGCKSHFLNLEFPYWNSPYSITVSNACWYVYDSEMFIASIFDVTVHDDAAIEWYHDDFSDGNYEVDRCNLGNK